MTSALVVASSAGSRARSAAKPSAAFRVGTTRTRRVVNRTPAGSQDDVGVVRQEKDFVGSDAFDRVQEFARRRVVGLAAVHDRRDSIRIEDSGQAVARGDRHDGQWHGLQQRYHVRTFRAGPVGTRV